MSKKVICSIKDLHVTFPVRRKGKIFAKPDLLRAVNGVSFDIYEGETIGVVGESGCGKSTLGRAILQLIKPSGGSVTWMGKELTSLKKDQMLALRQDMQIVFQDPLASLNPRMTVGEIIAEPLRTFEPKLNHTERLERVRDVMGKVGLRTEYVNRYPHEFSGGQCQRIGIARAIILKPKLIVCDEPVSALDVSIQAQIVNLLMDLQKEMNLSLVFISHDLSVVRHICHRIGVFYLGRLVELADRNELYANPRHPYTQALISAVPIPDPKLEKNKQHMLVEGDIPSPLNPPSGCPFRTRCPKATDVCATSMPEYERVDEGHKVACYHHS